MNLGALVDLGADLQALKSELKKLDLGGWDIEVKKDSRGGIAGTLLKVVCSENNDDLHSHCGCDAEREHSHHHIHTHGHEHEDASRHSHAHRSFKDIRALIENSALKDSVKKNAIGVFEKLAAAEGQVHDKPAQDVQFHEVGAVDSIIDIVGAAICYDLLKADRAVSTAVELGGGTVKCAHGRLPVPAPATALLAKNFPSKLNGAPHECTTPTGAAIIAHYAKGFAEKLEGKVLACGIGVGHRDSPALPNVLRVMLIETQENASPRPYETAKMCVLSANIDDMTAEHTAYLCQKLFESGASDVWQESIVMKKSRLAAKVCALVFEGDANAVIEAFFKNSTSLGIRQNAVDRHFIKRSAEVALIDGETLSFKRSEFCGTVRTKPEFEDCTRRAEKSAAPVFEVTRKLANEIEKKTS